MATEKKPAAKKAAPAVKKAAPAAKKAAAPAKKAAAPVAKKAAPAAKKAAPVEKVAPVEKAAPKKVETPAAEPKFVFTQKKKKDKADKPASNAPAAKQNVDPARAAFLAALDKKKQGHSGAQSGVNNPDKSDAQKSGPDAARRMFQRRSGAS